MLPHVFAVHNNSGSVEKVTLLGIPQFPRLVVGTPSSTGGTNTIGWRFKSDGVIMPYLNGELTNAAEEWNTNAPNPKENYWIKMTFNNALPGGTPPNNTVSNWSSLSTTREVTWTLNAGPADGSVKVEIATDSLGQDIVATGYYGIRFETR